MNDKIDNAIRKHLREHNMSDQFSKFRQSITKIFKESIFKCDYHNNWTFDIKCVSIGEIIRKFVIFEQTDIFIVYIRHENVIYIPNDTIIENVFRDILPNTFLFKGCRIILPLKNYAKLYDSFDKCFLDEIKIYNEGQDNICNRKYDGFRNFEPKYLDPEKMLNMIHE